jgi:hypothetical protein
MSRKAVVSVNRNAIAGILFIGFGALFGIYSLSYRIGTVLRMGPGLFPLAISLLLVFLGLAVFVRAIVRRRSEEIPGTLRPMFMISVAVIVFAASINRLGLIGSIITLVLLSGLGSKPFQAGRLLALGAPLAAVCSVLFVYFLGIPLRVFPNLGN